MKWWQVLGASSVLAMAGCGGSGGDPSQHYRIVYTGGSNIWRMDSNGSNPIELVPGGSRFQPAGTEMALHPTWTPDGKKIIFYSDTGSENFIDVMKEDGTVRKHLTLGGAQDPSILRI